MKIFEIITLNVMFILQILYVNFQHIWCKENSHLAHGTSTYDDTITITVLRQTAPTQVHYTHVKSKDLFCSLTVVLFAHFCCNIFILSVICAVLRPWTWQFCLYMSVLGLFKTGLSLEALPFWVSSFTCMRHPTGYYSAFKHVVWFQGFM